MITPTPKAAVKVAAVCRCRDSSTIHFRARAIPLPAFLANVRAAIHASAIPSCFVGGVEPRSAPVVLSFMGMRFTSFGSEASVTITTSASAARGRPLRTILARRFRPGFPFEEVLHLSKREALRGSHQERPGETEASRQKFHQERCAGRSLGRVREGCHPAGLRLDVGLGAARHDQIPRRERDPQGQPGATLRVRSPIGRGHCARNDVAHLMMHFRANPRHAAANLVGGIVGIRQCRTSLPGSKLTRSGRFKHIRHNPPDFAIGNRQGKILPGDDALK